MEALIKLLGRPEADVLENVAGALCNAMANIGALFATLTACDCLAQRPLA